jgi:hypothetical protein
LVFEIECEDENEEVKFRQKAASVGLALPIWQCGGHMISYWPKEHKKYKQTKHSLEQDGPSEDYLNSLSLTSHLF